MKGDGKWKSKKEKKGQGRSELEKRDRKGGIEKGCRRLRRERWEGKVHGRRWPLSPLASSRKNVLFCSSTPGGCSCNSCRESHSNLVE